MATATFNLLLLLLLLQLINMTILGSDNTGYVCDTCREDQGELLESGDSSQVLCNHPDPTAITTSPSDVCYPDWTSNNDNNSDEDEEQHSPPLITSTPPPTLHTSTPQDRTDAEVAEIMVNAASRGRRYRQ